MVKQGLVTTRSQAENLIKLGEVSFNGKMLKKPGFFVPEDAAITVETSQRYVSRAALKLASIADQFKVDFSGKVVLDVGSSTGGFTDFALQNGAVKVIAIDVGTKQLHESLQGNTKIELHEQTDIRDINKLSSSPDIVLIDVSFISLRAVLPHLASLLQPFAFVIAMVKPQFESTDVHKHKGVIKNERLRRSIMKDFETWVKKYFVLVDKADSKVAGGKGNIERFYLLKRL